MFNGYAADEFLVARAGASATYLLHRPHRTHDAARSFDSPSGRDGGELLDVMSWPWGRLAPRTRAYRSKPRSARDSSQSRFALPGSSA